MRSALAMSPPVYTSPVALGDAAARAKMAFSSPYNRGFEDWTLNISRYVLPPIQIDIPPLPEAITAFRDALTRCREAEARLEQVMTEGG